MSISYEQLVAGTERLDYQEVLRKLSMKKVRMHLMLLTIWMAYAL